MIRNLTAALILTAVPLCAQSAWTEPQIHETPQEFSTVGLFLGDASLDLAVIDRATGAVRIGEKLPGGGVNWTTHLTGVTDVSAAQAGSATAGGADFVALTSLSWNRVEFVTATGALSSADYVGLDISALAPNLSGLEVLLDTPLASASAAAPFLARFSKATGQHIASTASPPLRSGGTLRTSAAQRYAALIDEVAHELQLWSAAPAKVATLASLPAGAQFTEIITQSSAGGPAIYGAAIWAPGGTQIVHAPLSALPAFLATSAITAPFPLGQVRYLDLQSGAGGGTILLLTSSTGAQAAKVKLPFGSLTLQTLQSFTPPAGQTFTGAEIIGDSKSIHFLRGTGGITAESQEYTFNSATGAHSPGIDSPLPSVSGTRASANLYTFTGEPWVNPAAVFTNSFKSRDWTITATNAGGTLSVTALTDAGPAAGVGAPSAQSVTGAAAGSFAVPNQIRANISLASMGQSIGTPRPVLRFDPAPGIYRSLTNPDGSPYGLPIRIDNPAGLTALRFRSNGGAWQDYDDNARPVLSATALIEAHGAVPGAETASPTARGSYQIGGTGALLPGTVVDANSNGLSDAWEKAFAITDPNADTDGDGSSNLAEYSAGTDPRNPGIVSSATMPLLFIAPAGTGYEVFWDSANTAVILETSTDLQTPWAMVPGGSITVSGLRYTYSVSGTAISDRRFFRLRTP